MTIIPTTIKSKELVAKKREQIVLAAINLFAKKGFHGATLRELSEVAGISHGNIYDYIGSKEDIFFLMHEFMANLADEALDSSMEKIDDPLEKLRRMVRSEFNIMYEWADAVLLIYQEGHILNKPLLKKLLQRESEHIRKYEQVLDDCVKRGLLRESNTLVIANLIKVMVDAWVLKRWSLRKHVSQLAMERAILDLVFHGLINGKPSGARELGLLGALEGKSILFVNAGTVLGKAITTHLLSRGSKLAIHIDDTKGGAEFPCSNKGRRGKVKLYSTKKDGQITPHLFEQIVKDCGPIDIIIQDLGASYGGKKTSRKYETSICQDSEENFKYAQNMSSLFEAKMTERGTGKILYLAPWAWNKYEDPLRYETVRAGIISLTQTLAKRMAVARINVNCIIPGFIGDIKDDGEQKIDLTDLLKQIPMGFLGEIADILETVYFLISDLSKYITGQVIEVGGGAK